MGEECQLGPNTPPYRHHRRQRCVIDETVAVEAVLADDVDCGPRAYLRPGTHMLDGSKAGTHVEIKKSTIGEGSKVPHLSYIGDTTIGAGVNVGRGLHHLQLRRRAQARDRPSATDAFIGSDTMMVAPVSIGAARLPGRRLGHHRGRVPRTRSASGARVR